MKLHAMSRAAWRVALAAVVSVALALQPALAFAHYDAPDGQPVQTGSEPAPAVDAEVVPAAGEVSVADGAQLGAVGESLEMDEASALEEGVALASEEAGPTAPDAEDREDSQLDGTPEDDLANDDRPSSLASTLNPAKGTLLLSWGKAQAEDASYEVWWRRAGTDSWVKRATDKLSFTITGLKAGRAYEARVYAAGGDYLAVYRFVGTTSVSTGMSTSFAVKATAVAVSGASGYDFATQRYGGSWVFEDAGASTTMSYQLAEGELVGFKARPYLVLDGVKYEGAWSAGDYRFSDTVRLSTTLSFTSKKLTATCAKLEAPAGVMNYRIVYRQGTSGKWNAQVKEASSRTISKLTAGKVCQVGAAPVVKVSGRSYLGAYEYQYRYVVGTSINKATLGGEKRTVAWTKNAEATGYQLIRSTDPNFKSYTTYALDGADATSYTVDGLDAEGTYYFKVRAVKAVAGKAYYGPWSASKTSSKSLEDVMLAKAQGYSSSTKWLILIDCTNNKTAVFTGSKGNWTLHRFMDCSTGASVSPTVKGSFTVGNRGTHFGEEKGYTCWYWTQFYGDYLFHSVLYEPYSKTEIQDGRLGMNLSHGCVRMDIADAKWIYDTIPRGTKVISY